MDPSCQFVGATDSAVPCAFMLDLAEALDPLLNLRQQRLEDGLEDDEDVAETTLQLVFFDGEEAFKDWTDTDSIYGARYVHTPTQMLVGLVGSRLCRHLAHKWSTTYIQPHTKRRLLPFMDTELDTIEDLILLDLLGAPNPTIRSSFIETAWLFDAMISAEQRLGESGAFNYNQQNTAEWKSFFVPRRGNFGGFGISDDHIPFLQLGVTILHVISSPFPNVWHTIKV